MNNKKFRKSIYSLSTIILVLTITISSVQFLYASPLYYPRPGAGGNADNNSTVAISGIGSGPTWGLNAPVTRYRILSNDATPIITIEYSCEGNNHGAGDFDDADYESSGGVSQTTWNIYRTDPSSNQRTGSRLAYVSSAEERTQRGATVCAQTYRPAQRNIIGSGQTRSQVPGFTNFYVFEVEVRESSHTTSSGGTATDGAGKGFRVRTNDGYVTPIDVYTYQPGRVLASSNPSATAPSNTYGSALLGRLRTDWASDSSVRVLNGQPVTNYTFRFSPDCRIAMPADGSGVPVYLFWYDMDYGVDGNFSGSEQLVIYENGTQIPDLVARRPGTTSPHGGGSSLMNAELNGGLSGSARWGAVEFDVKRDAEYTVQFRNIHYSSNALEVYLPFPDYGGTFSCPDPVHDIEKDIDSCDAIGYYYYPRNRNEKYPVNFQFKLGTGGSWSPTYTDTANRTGAIYGTGSGNGFQRAPPSNRISATQSTYVRAWVNYQDGPADWLTSSSTGLNLGLCASWNYDPTITPTGTRSVKPGETFTVSTRVNNTGNVTGDSYLHELGTISGNWNGNIDVTGYTDQTGTHSVTRGATLEVDWNNRNGVAGGNNSPTRTVTFQVDASASHGETICFEARVSPAGANPIVPLDTTRDGQGTVYTSCIEVYNLQYDVDVRAPSGGSTSWPDTPVQMGFALINQPNGHNSANGHTPNDPNRIIAQYSNVYLKNNPSGYVNSTRVDSIPAGGSVPFDVTINIPSDAQVGQEYCVRLRVAGAWGYSDGSDFSSSRVHPGSGDPVEEACVKVYDGPYLQAFGNDVWVGDGFDYDGSNTCSQSGTGEIRSHVRSNAGAMSEYAAYAWGSITSFGTASVPSGNYLTFANNPSDGYFDHGRCLSGIFDNGGSGGNINDSLWNQASSSTNVNDINSNGDGQFAYDNDLTLNNINNNQSTKTVLINGDLTIRNNITKQTSGWTYKNVPVYVFIVSGDILIESGVSRIDAFLISNGMIDTCHIGPLNERLAVEPNDQGCDNHLEINGQLVAQNIAWRRVSGGTNEAATGVNVGNRCRSGDSFYDSDNMRCAAETVRWNPAYFLADPLLDYGTGGGPNNLPIQQIRSLPPIY